MTDTQDKLFITVGEASRVTRLSRNYNPEIGAIMRASRFSAVTLMLIASIAFAVHSIATADLRAPRYMGVPVEDQRFVSLSTRVFVPAVDIDAIDTEADNATREETHTLSLDRSVLVLIDVWASHPNDGWVERAKPVTAGKIAPVVDAAHTAGLQVVHAPYTMPIDPAITIGDGDVNADDAGLSEPAAFDRWLKASGIDTLIYAGYASNWCVTHRPIGMMEMKRRGYKIIFIRDASIAFETAESLDGEWMHRSVVNWVEIENRTTTAAEFVAAMESVQ